MSLKILIVKSENDFFSQLNDLFTSRGEKFDVTCVSNRKEAITALQETTFDRIITALKIPRISDGYIFLSHVLKILGNDKVFVVVDEKSDQIMRSMNHVGAKHLYSASNVKDFLSVLAPTDRTGSPVVAGKSANDLSPDAITEDVEKVKDDLGLVTGPSGGMYF
jgi:CheY-like chemotaxis protein